MINYRLSFGLGIVAALAGACIAAPNGTEEVVTSDEPVVQNGVDATLSITSDWGGGYCADVTFKNGSSAAVTNWQVVVNTGGSTISQVWSAAYTTTGTQMTATPAAFNASIAQGASTSFGFCGAGTGRPSIASLTVTGGQSTSSSSSSSKASSSSSSSSKSSSSSFSSSTSSSSSKASSSSSSSSSTSSSSSKTSSSSSSTSSSSSKASSSSSSSSSTGSSYTSGVGPNCGKDDANLAGIEPQMPTTVCQTITSTSTNIQSALNSCAGKGAVKLTGVSSFSVASLTLGAGAKLWIDSGVTLYLTGSASPGIISVTGANAGIYGPGTIDAANAASGTTMIHSYGDYFELYKVHIHNSQKMHVKVQGNRFVLWGNTLISSSSSANTDGIDPGAGKSGVDTTNGYIVCNTISVGDDQIAVKGTQGKVTNLTIAHNYFGAGHGMSIGSETGPGGINGMKVYDLTVDGDYYPSAKAVNANAIRIKSYDGAGGPVDNVSYENICGRNLHNAILLETNYTAGTVTGGGKPDFGAVSIKDFHLLRGSGTQTPVISIDGTSPSRTQVTLNNVVVDGLTTPITATNATVTVGPGGASPGVGSATTGTPHAIDCSSRFITFPSQ